MDAQAHYPDQPASPTLVAALAALAKLAQQILVANSPDSMNWGAALLLKHLLRLADRQQGALLLVNGASPTSSSSSWPQDSQRRPLRLLSLEGMDLAQDLYPLLADEWQNEERAVVVRESGWLICHHRLALSLDASSPTALGGAPRVPEQQVLLLLGGSRQQAQSQQESSTRIQQNWPWLADAVGTVIMSLLQVEKMEEQELARQQHALEQMDLFKAELVATVSHELRSPLASIQGYAATLLRHEKRIGREERHEFLLAIEQAGRRLGTVIDRLLELSQLETGNLVLTRVPVNLIALAREAITAREHRLGESDPSPSTSARWAFALQVQDAAGNPTGAFPVVTADRRLLREVLDQLVENAVLYSPAGGTIVIGLRVRDAEQVKQGVERVAKLRAGVVSPLWEKSEPMVEIWVQDQGVGIESAHLEQVFERFYRVDTSLSRTVNGLGIGLTMCKRIAELHGGLLWGESEVGSGSTFHLLLPLRQPDDTLNS